MDITRNFPVDKNRNDNVFIFGPFSKSEGKTVDESDAIRRAFKKNEVQGTLVDVGAHRGTVSLPFLKDGWKVFAFEPDAQNSRHLLRRQHALKKSYRDQLTFIPYGVSDEPDASKPFFRSTESSGVSGLSSFLVSHQSNQSIRVDTLANFYREYEISACTFLKVDVEGFDFKVLQGFPWNECDSPDVIECEFEDRKTLPLGYCWTDMALYLEAKGYKVFVSEWHEVVKYGVQHNWLGLKRWPCKLDSERNWGNIIATKIDNFEESIVTGFQESVSGLQKRAPIELRSPGAKRFSPPKGDNIYLHGDDDDFYREIFDYSFRPDDVIAARISFFCYEKCDLKIMLIRHGVGTPEASHGELKACAGYNEFEISHTVKHFHDAFGVQFMARSPAFVILNKVNIKFSVKSREQNFEIVSEHPKRDSSTVNHEQVAEVRARLKDLTTGMYAKLAYYINLAKSPGELPEERFQAFSKFFEEVGNSFDLIDHHEVKSIFEGLREIENISSYAKNTDFEIELNPLLLRPKEDGLPIWDCLIGKESKATEIFDRFEAPKGGRYVFNFELVNASANFLARIYNGENLIWETEVNSEPPYQVIQSDILELAKGASVRMEFAGSYGEVSILSCAAQMLGKASVDRRDFLDIATATMLRRIKKESKIRTPAHREDVQLRDLERLAGLRGKFSGERVFIMGNGPSLNKTPLELLKNEFVFGVNRVSLLFNRIDWRPTFFTAFDTRVVPDNAEEFSNVDIEYKFFSPRYRDIMGVKDNHYFHAVAGHYSGFGASFTKYAPYYGFGGGGR